MHPIEFIVSLSRCPIFRLEPETKQGYGGIGFFPRLQSVSIVTYFLRRHDCSISSFRNVFVPRNYITGLLDEIGGKLGQRVCVFSEFLETDALFETICDGQGFKDPGRLAE